MKSGGYAVIVAVIFGHLLAILGLSWEGFGAQKTRHTLQFGSQQLRGAKANPKDHRITQEQAKT